MTAITPQKPDLFIAFVAVVLAFGGGCHGRDAKAISAVEREAGQVALDSMLRKAGWEPVSSSTTAEATIWHYRKDQRLGSLVLENQQQQCGRRFRVQVAEPL